MDYVHAARASWTSGAAPDIERMMQGNDVSGLGAIFIGISLRRCVSRVHTRYAPERGIELLVLWLDNIAMGVHGLGEVEYCEHARDGEPEVRLDEVCSCAFPTVRTRER